MKYYIKYAIDGRYVVEVEADSLEEALDKADEKYCNADFGALEDIIDAEIVRVEDENENPIW